VELRVWRTGTNPVTPNRHPSDIHRVSQGTKTSQDYIFFKKARPDIPPGNTTFHYSKKKLARLLGMF